MQPFAADLARTPPIESAQFWKQPYRVPASSDPDTATAQTILLMCGQVRESARDAGRETFADQSPMVSDTARGAFAQFGGLSGYDLARSSELTARAIAESAFWWCKTFVRFVHHEFIIRQRLGEAGHLQGLISPEVLVRMAKPEGDCAIFSECVAAFLTVFGIPYEFVTAAVNPDEPEIFSHVYLYAVLPDGSRFPLDASHGKYPGWQVPSAHVSRRQVWDSSGNPVADHGSRFDGLHNYALRGGLGDGVDPETGEPYGTGVAPVDPYLQPGGTSYDLGPGYFGAAPPAGSVTAPAQNSAQWAQFATAALKSGLTLAEINAIQPGTVVGPNGQILRQNPGYAVGTPTGALNLGSGISTSMLMLGGLALVAILFMSSKGGR